MAEDLKPEEKMILKAKVEQELCLAVGSPIMGMQGHDIIAQLMCLSIHDVHKVVGNFLRYFDSEFGVERPKDWNAFSSRVSKTRFENDEYKNLSSKAKGLRDASYILSFLADCFEYIEKADLKPKKED